MADLQGITILDLTLNAPGQAACSALADMGASVIAVTRPGYAAARGFNGAWSVGRNKRSITLNLQDPRAREVFYKLARASDVIVEGFRPGVVNRLGVGYESIRKIQPKIIYCSLSGYGQDGPYRDFPGHDINYQAIAGMVPLDKKGRPFLPTTNWADRQASTNLEVAILLALVVRERHGVGQYVDVSYADASTTIPADECFKTPGIDRVLPGGPPGSESPPSKNLQGIYPAYNMYQCKDGKYISLGIIESWFWEKLCVYFGKPEWAKHQTDEGKMRARVRAFLRRKFKEKPRDEWFHILSQQVGTQVAPVNIGYEVMDDPHMRARESVIQVETPGGGKMWQVGVPYKLSVTKGKVWRAATVAGQDTVAILKELGYGAADIETFRKENVVEVAEGF